MDRRAAWRGSWPVEDAALAGPNHFNLLRLLAALLVLYSHSYHLLGQRAEEAVGAWFNWFDASVLGVSIFFFISGFLVCRSWDARRNPVGFLLARALRIAPAYWCVLAIVALLVGPVFTTLPVADYFRDPRTPLYVALSAVIHTQYLLPGVFENAPAPGVNGSLWTIRLEVALYIMLAIAGALGTLATAGDDAGPPRWWRRPGVALLLVLAWLVLLEKLAFAGPAYYRLAGYFLLGVAAWRFRGLCRLRFDWMILLAIAAIALGRTWAGPVLMPLAIAQFVLTCALHPALRGAPGWLHRNDYSYGLYLYGFPVQQSLVALGIGAPWLLLACALPLTLCCAALSWHLVEQPILRRKDALIARALAWPVFRA